MLKALASQRRIALPVVRALIRDQPQVHLFMGLTGPMLDATATAEDKKWAALSTELNEQFDRGQKNYAALEQSAFHIFNAQEIPLFGSKYRNLWQVSSHTWRRS